MGDANAALADAAAAVAKLTGTIGLGGKCASNSDGNGCVAGHKCGKVDDTKKADAAADADKATEDASKETKEADGDKKDEEKKELTEEEKKAAEEAAAKKAEEEKKASDEAAKKKVEEAKKAAEALKPSAE